MDLGLSDQSYVVTGGSAGIGHSVVARLLDEGARVATCARDGDRLKRGWEGHDASDRLVTLSGDVLEQRDMERLISATAREFGSIHGVVANAGAGVSGTFTDTPNDVFMDQAAVKVLGTLNVVRAGLPGLRASGGRIVIVNGVTGRVADPAMAAVSASRAAVENLARSMAVELAPSGIAVSWVNPGPIDTGRQRIRHRESGSELPYEEWAAGEAARRGVLLRRFGTAREVADVVCFLLSPRASFVTGSGIDVAGGLGATYR